MFIYLTHFQFQVLMIHAGIRQPLVHVIVSILLGIALWRAYSWLAAQVMGRARRYIAEDEPGPA